MDMIKLDEWEGQKIDVRIVRCMTGINELICKLEKHITFNNEMMKGIEERIDSHIMKEKK